MEMGRHGIGAWIPNGISSNVQNKIKTEANTGLTMFMKRKKITA